MDHRQTRMDGTELTLIKSSQRLLRTTLSPVTQRMVYRLREIAGARNFAEELKLDALSRVVPPAQVQAALAAEGVGTQRARKLTVEAAVYVLIAGPRIYLVSRSVPPLSTIHTRRDPPA